MKIAFIGMGTMGAPMALNLLNQDRTTKLGIKAKRKKTGWDNQYLQTLLAS